MKDRMMRMMAGRYGNDPLNQVMTVVALVLMLASMLWQPLYVLALAVMVLVLLRTFSRNIEKRRAEAMAFERAKGSVVRFFKTGKNMAVGTKTHRYYKCPGCKQQVRAPRDVARMRVDALQRLAGGGLVQQRALQGRVAEARRAQPAEDRPFRKQVLLLRGARGIILRCRRVTGRRAGCT